MTSVLIGGSGSSRFPGGIDLVMFELSQFIDVDCFSRNPGASEFCRTADQFEIEMSVRAFPGAGDHEFKMVVNQLNEHVYLRRVLRRGGAFSELVGLSLITNPRSIAEDLASHQCGEICAT